MATSFQFEDLDLVGIANKIAGSYSPAPPSIVSMASDVFAGGLIDPEQFVPTSMADLFEGALCDDEIPSLLNLMPSTGNDEKAEEDLQLNASESKEPAKKNEPEVETPKVALLAPAPPAPEATVSIPASPVASSQNDKKREAPAKAAPKSHKKMRLAPVPRQAASQVLQAIRPMTALPSASEIYGGRTLDKDGINTSTAHIKALTGANGAAVCLDAIEKALQQSGNKADLSTIASLDADGKPLSAEEKAKQSRDRNRQHARNTRVRKKAYVEELKRTLNILVEERDLLVHQRRIEQQGTLEQKDVRFRVVEDFLNLRGRNEPDPRRWSMILEEGFQLRLPRADVPGVVCSSGGNEGTAGNTGPCNNYPLGTRKKVLTGVDEVVEDSKMVARLLQSLGASPLSVSYQCDRESFMMENASAVVNWMATSSGAVTKGASAEFSIEGSLRARFNPITNKLLNMEFSF